MKILMIDDDKDTCDVIQRYLKLKGNDVITKTNAKEAVELVESQEFDRILLDISMPDFSGIDFLSELEKRGLSKKNNILVYTAAQLADSEKESLVKNGATKVISKGIDLVKLNEQLVTI